MDKDIVWKTYLADDSRFADLVNGIMFHGEQVVGAADIQEVDTQTGYVKGKGQKKRGNVKIRDTLRRVRFGTGHARVGIECGEFVDYSMPLRDLDYNVGEYEKQAAKIRGQVRKQASGLSTGERLYRFKKDSRLCPVETITLYCGTEEWDGPRTLHDMLDFTGMPKEMPAFIPDYRAHIVEVRKMGDTGVFRTDVRQVLDFIRFSENKEALRDLVENDPYYQNMEEDAWDVVARYANAGELTNVKDYCRKDGKLDMCTAIKELVAEGRKAGVAEGRKAGIAEGRKAGIAEGRKAGVTEGRKAGRKAGKQQAQRQCVRNLMESTGWPEERAAAALKVTWNKKEQS